MLLLLAVTASGCTAGFVYNRLDWVVSWYVNGIVTLDDDQERQLQSIVQRTLDWHRETQIPLYVDLLQRLESDIAGPFSAADLEAYFNEIMALSDEFLRRVMPDTAAFLRTLSDEQVEQLRVNLEESNDELWEDFGGATPEQRKKRRLRSAIRATERFTGRLSGTQRQILQERLAGMHDVSEQWLERRRHWQARFLALLQDPLPAPAFEDALLDMALDPNQFDTADYRARVDANRATVMAMMAALLDSLDARQRGRAQKKFRGYAEDLRRIAESG
jgi:hypothetical protein